MSEYVGLIQGKVHDRREMSEYYCGGCGWPVTDHDSYCRECGGELHEGADNSRWHELFGTPEGATRTLETVADSFFAWAWSDEPATISDVVCALTGKCDECVAKGLPGRGVSTKCGEVDYDALLEWLRGDAE